MGYYDWTCPYCSRDATLSYANLHHDNTLLEQENEYGPCMLSLDFKICPNEKCKKFTLTATLSKAKKDEHNRWESKELIHFWNLLPRSKAQTFPKYVPKAVIEDYDEACLIKDLSPKASATLSRRCLQGIIRDFWKVKPGRLVDEIAEIQGKIDPLTWGAIEAVRKVGNIGAHMEKDIDLMVDVEPQEAELLIGLIEVLIKDWYVATENRKNHMNALINVAAQKNTAKQKPAAAAA
jgi:hypothetical protein